MTTLSRDYWRFTFHNSVKITITTLWSYVWTLFNFQNEDQLISFLWHVVLESRDYRITCKFAVKNFVTKKNVFVITLRKNVSMPQTQCWMAVISSGRVQYFELPKVSPLVNAVSVRGAICRKKSTMSSVQWGAGHKISFSRLGVITSRAMSKFRPRTLYI